MTISINTKPACCLCAFTFLSIYTLYNIHIIDVYYHLQVSQWNVEIHTKDWPTDAIVSELCKMKINVQISGSFPGRGFHKINIWFRSGVGGGGGVPLGPWTIFASTRWWWNPLPGDLHQPKSPQNTRYISINDKCPFIRFLNMGKNLRHIIP